jgi:LacI family transcriptional regulator
MKRNKDVTIYDIAERLNLAASTISRALKDHHSIGKTTTQLVKKTATEMGFRPNSMAASLRNKKTKTIGVLIPRINRPFMSTLVSGIEESLQKAGYNVIIIQSNDSYKNEVKMTKVLYSNRVSGVICSLAMETTKTIHFQQLIDNGIPVVFVDRVPKDIKTCNIMIDNYIAAYKATQHLIDQGCKRIAHFAGSQFTSTYSERTKGYIDAMKNNHLIVDEDLIIDFKILSHEEGEMVTNNLLDLKNPPDGIFSSNDTAAVAAIQIAKKRNIKIPEDLAIIGFNNDPISLLINPSLSSVTHPAYKMGTTSAEQILSYIDSSTADNFGKISILETELVIRQSSKRI